MTMLTPEAAAQENARLDARRAEIDAAVASCPHCKAAKTRKAKAISAVDEYEDWFGEDPAARRRAEYKPTECSRHSSARRLLWVTSPLSETYWSS